jgi:hypothetical protein
MIDNTLSPKMKKQASIRLNRSFYDLVYKVCEDQDRSPSNLMNLLLKKSNISKNWKTKNVLNIRKLKEKQTYPVAFRVDFDIYKIVEKIATKNQVSISSIFYILIFEELKKLQPNYEPLPHN